MKTFTLILLLSVFAVAFTAPILSSTDSKAVSVQELSARRLKLPAKVKKILKGIVVPIVGTLIDCIFGFFADSLNNIPFFKNLPFVKKAEKGKDKLRQVVTKKVGQLIDKLKRIRRLQMKRELFIKKIIKKAGKGISKVAKKAVKEAGKVVKKHGKNVGKHVKKVAKGAVKVVKNAGQLAKALDKLTGGKLSMALIKMGCPMIAKVVQYGLDYALKALGFPGVPPCIPKAIEDGCVKGVRKAFKRQMLLRRLSLAF
jgi:histone H3/H4